MWHTRSQMLEMESKGVIGIFTPRFLSNISIVKQTKKRDKWVCPIINPTRNKPLAAIQAFQDGVSLIRELRQGNLMIRLELKDAYFQSQSVHQTHFFQFLWRNQVWEIKVLSISFSSTQWCFRKLLKPVVVWLRLREHHMAIYLNNKIMSQDTVMLMR